MVFGQISLNIVQGLWSDFGATKKIHKKSNFDWNKLKLSTQHKYMYMHQKNYKNGEFSLMKFGQSPCTIVQGLWPDFGAT